MCMTCNILINQKKEKKNILRTLQNNNNNNNKRFNNIIIVRHVIDARDRLGDEDKYSKGC